MHDAEHTPVVAVGRQALLRRRWGSGELRAVGPAVPWSAQGFGGGSLGRDGEVDLVYPEDGDMLTYWRCKCWFCCQ